MPRLAHFTLSARTTNHRPVTSAIQPRGVTMRMWRWMEASVSSGRSRPASRRKRRSRPTLMTTPRIWSVSGGRMKTTARKVSTALVSATSDTSKNIEAETPTMNGITNSPQPLKAMPPRLRSGFVSRPLLPPPPLMPGQPPSQ